MRSNNKNRTIYSVLIIICIVGFWIFENFYTPDTHSNKKVLFTGYEFPDTYLPSSKSGEIIHHTYYSLSYSEPYEQAEWVAYMLSSAHLTYDDRVRPYFIEDPYVGSKSADWRNYRGSGYDRGHLCPAGDRRFSEQAYNETFYTSNISPQDREFNTGIWNDLEQQIRRWAKKYDELFVFTGGVLERGLEEIGDEDVDVPNSFFKIIARRQGNRLKTIAFLIPNKPQSVPLSKFVVSIDEIELDTGIDFFQQLSIHEQDAIEKGIDKNGWQF
ncbi:DNA/RNA non-specific endonuclease [Maribacter sp. CXY002]|uniref:DNA/RNA non-specific endonuclease n=1 Tax=Maribacter luteocoastalis TaxID=3407671 RepID=UPI003B6704DD